METVHPKYARSGDLSSFRERELPFNSKRLRYSSKGQLSDQYQRAGASICYVFQGNFAEVEDVLYHYTKLENFESIVHSGEFWASHHSAMNDFKEIEHAWDLLAIQTSHLLTEKRENGVEKFETAKNALLSDLAFFIVSFSRSGNMLSQWKEYARPSGVSIGIPACMFPSLGTGFSPYKLCNVVYDPGEQVKLITPLARKLAEILNDVDDLELIKMQCAKIKKTFKEVAPILKHPGFTEEREVRLVADGSTFRIEERNVGQRRIQYVRISYLQAFAETPSIDVPIWHIYTSPSRNPDASVQKVDNILSAHKRKFASISECGIPFNSNSV